MKSTNKKVIATLAILGIFCTANANEFEDAFKNAKISGDAAVTFEQRDQKKVTPDPYYKDDAYSVGSVELLYKTGSFYNFSLAYGMRGYRVLWENDENTISGYGTSAGTGDASSRFFKINSGEIAVTSNAYIAYDTDKIHFKAGRQDLSTEWLTKKNDAISLFANPTDKLELELIWSHSRYRMSGKELFYGFTLDGSVGVINSEGGGIYKAGLTYKASNSLKAKAYALHAPDNYSVYGSKVTLDTKIDEIGIGGFVHYMQTNEISKNNPDSRSYENGELLDVTVYVDVAGYKTTLGYIQTGKDGGLGSAYKGGDTINNFEEGDQFYSYIGIDVHVPYAKIEKTFAGVELTGLYGIFDYTSPNDLKKYQKSEFNLYAKYDITEKLNLCAVYTYVDEDEDDTLWPAVDMSQYTAMLVYKF